MDGFLRLPAAAFFPRSACQYAYAPRLAQLPPGFPQKHVCAGPVCFSPLRQGCGRLRRNGLRPGFDFSLRFV